MKKILGLVLYAAVMFGVTAGLGVFMMKKNASTHSDANVETEEANGHPSASQATPHQSNSPYIMTADATSAHNSTTTVQVDEQLPVAVRANPMSVEEIVRMGMSLKEREKALRKREASIRDAESHQRLIQSDVESAKQDVENILGRTNDQRAAIEELVARINAQKEAINNERLAITNDQQLLKSDRDKLDADRRQLEAQKTALAQSETEFQLKRRELDAERSKYETERSKFTVDSDKLVKDRDKWVTEVERLSQEKQQVAAEKELLRVERATLEQDKRLLASTPGAAAVLKNTTPIDPESARQNQKNTTAMLEGMTPETAASTIKALCADGGMDMVVDSLLLIEQRKMSAILEALEDKQLISEFITRIQSRKIQPKSAKN